MNLAIFNKWSQFADSELLHIRNRLARQMDKPQAEWADLDRAECIRDINDLAAQFGALVSQGKDSGLGTLPSENQSAGEPHANF